MTRGRPPQKALDEALPIAQARGNLLRFLEEPAFDCDYMFLATDRLCIVRVKRTRHLWCTPGQMEAQCGEAIQQFRHLPVPAFVSREIWFWSPYSVFRFFRIEDAGLVELDRDGKVFATPRTEHHAAAKQPAPVGTPG
jgi:hypothetical protein